MKVYDITGENEISIGDDIIFSIANGNMFIGSILEIKHQYDVNDNFIPHTTQVLCGKKKGTLTAWRSNSNVYKIC